MSNIKKVMEWKKCEFIGCTNTFYGSQFQRFCNDEKCIDARREVYEETKKSKIIQVNRIINKNKFKKKIRNGQVLIARCKAKDHNDERCKNTFVIEYNPGIEVYPSFCEEHRNSYKRELFSKMGATNGKSANFEDRRTNI